MSEKYDRSLELEKKVQDGSIVIMLNDVDFRWQVYRIEEIHSSRSGSKHYHIDNKFSMACYFDKRRYHFETRVDNRSWDDGGEVYEIFLYDAIAVFDTLQEAMPTIEQLTEQEKAYLAETKEARDRFSVFIRLITC